MTLELIEAIERSNALIESTIEAFTESSNSIIILARENTKLRDLNATLCEKIRTLEISLEKTNYHVGRVEGENAKLNTEIESSKFLQEKYCQAMDKLMERAKLLETENERLNLEIQKQP